MCFDQAFSSSHVRRAVNLIFTPKSAGCGLQREGACEVSTCYAGAWKAAGKNRVGQGREFGLGRSGEFHRIMLTETERSRASQLVYI